MRMILIIFQKKKFVWGNKWTILGPKMAHPHNSGSAVYQDKWVIFPKMAHLLTLERL